MAGGRAGPSHPDSRRAHPAATWPGIPSRPPLTTVLLTAFVLVFQAAAVWAGAPGAPRTETPTVVPSGAWGGEHARMEVTAGGASLEFDCAFGFIEVPLTVDEDGAFSVPGTVAFESGGPVRHDQPPPKRHPVRFDGWTDGELMTLTVTFANEEENEFGKFSLGLGRRATLNKCL